jgi:hypothetical protein
MLIQQSEEMSMASVVDLWNRLCGDMSRPEVTPTTGPPSDRSAGQMIAGCEYELRQLRRDVTRTGSVTGAERLSGEPFVLGAKLRSAAYRARLAAVVEGERPNPDIPQSV